MIELPAALHAKIQQLCAEGDRFAAAQDFEQAIACYNDAWLLVPDPKHQWNASTWIMAAIGDAAFLGGFGGSALDALRFAMHCPDGIGNPFLHLRLGQVLMDRNEPEEAADELARAYMGGGREIFADQDPRYFTFLTTRMAIE